MYSYPIEGDLEEIKIELTKKCPLSCIHCSSDASFEKLAHLPIDAVLSLIRQAASLNIKSIAFSGGEPLLWPGLADAIKLSKSFRLQTSLYTTGINSSEDGTSEINKLSEYGLNRVIFSLYSPDKSRHEGITRKSGSFDKTLNVIRGLNRNNIKIELHFVPLKINYKDLNPLIKLSNTLGISQISILRFVPQGRGIMLKKSREMLMLDQTIELRNMILSLRNSIGGNIRLGSPYNILLLNGNTECIAAQKTLCIGPNGNVYPCDAFKNIEPKNIGIKDPFNNVLKHSLKTCWEKSEYLDAIRKYLMTPFAKPCSDCLYLERCRSGCLAQKVINQQSIKNGNIIKRPDPLCLKGMIGG
jgi:radical SAM protein with 4Fe4S-binding SPASM domain